MASEDFHFLRLIPYAIGAVMLLFLCGVLSYALNLGGFFVDTQVNNRFVQPLQRSRLDNDAAYRRGIEAQARGLVSRYQAGEARYQTDQRNLADWLKANPDNWSLMQTEEYNNLKAQVDGDLASITQDATDYNNLVSNPDNAGLFQFDPDLPQQLDPTVPTPAGS